MTAKEAIEKIKGLRLVTDDSKNPMLAGKWFMRSVEELKEILDQVDDD